VGAGAESGDGKGIRLTVGFGHLRSLQFRWLKCTVRIWIGQDKEERKKRDGNTEFTEKGTQRAEVGEENRKHNAEAQRTRRRAEKEKREERFIAAKTPL